MVVAGCDVVDVCGVVVASGGVPPPGGCVGASCLLGGAAHGVWESCAFVVVFL